MKDNECCREVKAQLAGLKEKIINAYCEGWEASHYDDDRLRSERGEEYADRVLKEALGIK